MKSWVIESMSVLFIHALKKVHFPFPLKLSTESHLVIQKKNGSTLHTSVPTNSISDTKWNQDTLGVTSFEYFLGPGCSLQKVPQCIISEELNENICVYWMDFDVFEVSFETFQSLSDSLLVCFLYCTSHLKVI